MKNLNKNLVIVLIVGLLIGAGAGYGVGYMIYQQEITSLETSLSGAESEIVVLEAQVSTLQGELENSTIAITGLQSSLGDVLGEVATMETTISAVENACVQAGALGWGESFVRPYFGEVVATGGDYELRKGVEIYYNHTWDSTDWVFSTFGKGEIVNTCYSLNNLVDGSSTMWGTHVLEFYSGITLTGTFFGRRYRNPEQPLPNQPDSFITLARWESFGDGYKVIWWFDSRNVGSEDSGVIIKM